MIGAIITAAAGIGSALIGHNAQKRAANAQKASFRKQAALQTQQAGMYLQSANMTSVGAKSAIEAGKANARNARLMAAQLQNTEDFNLMKINKERRQKIGTGRANFAANGVLVDSGAAAMWEQDEEADAVIEKLQVMQSVEDTAWNYMVEAKKREAEGYAQAAGIYGQASSMATQAWSSALGARGSLQQAAAVQGPSALATALNIAGSLGGLVGEIAGNSPANAAKETAKIASNQAATSAPVASAPVVYSTKPANTALSQNSGIQVLRVNKDQWNP